jgi:hypothetical protein
MKGLLVITSSGLGKKNNAGKNAEIGHEPQPFIDLIGIHSVAPIRVPFNRTLDA